MIRRARGDLIAYKAIHGGDIDDSSVFSRDHSLGGHGPRYPESPEKINLHLILELGVCDLLSGSNRPCAGIVY